MLPALIMYRHFLIDSTWGNPFLHTATVVIVPILLALMYAFVIFEQNELSKSLFKAGNMKTFSFLGKISYGFYAYHMIAFALVLSLVWASGISIQYDSLVQWLFFFALSLAVAFLLAITSYTLMEKKFLKWRPK